MKHRPIFKGAPQNQKTRLISGFHDTTDGP
jgi:hypothetical protein